MAALAAAAAGATGATQPLGHALAPFAGAPSGAARGHQMTRRQHEARARKHLAGSGKTGQDYAAWFRHLAYGAPRPTTAHPDPREDRRFKHARQQILEGRRQRDAEREARNARRRKEAT